MKITKTLIAASIAATMTAQADITLSDNLTMYGYIDAAATYLDGDLYGDSDGVDTFDSSIAEIEIGFAWANDGPWSAVAELSFRPDGSDANAPSDIVAETVTITYSASDELSFTVGNILSYQGFETYDATGLYQFSAQGNQGYVYSAAYAYGASVDYVTDDFGFGVWIGEGSEALSVEVLAQYTGVEGLTLKAIYANDPGYETINVWGSYSVGDFTFAAEYTDTDDVDAGEDLTAIMGLINYAMGDAAITLRYSDVDYDAAGDFSKVTVSPSYAFSDEVFGLLEASFVDVNGVDGTELAAELIYSF